jgi:ABC-type multidrug transport system fused ATPase/permease subunit
MNLFRRYIELLLRAPGDRRRLTLLVVMMTIGALMEALGVGLIMPFIGLLGRPSLVTESRPLAAAMRLTGVQTATGATMLIGALLMLVFVVKNVYLAAITWLQLRFLSNRATMLSRDLLAGYLGRRYTFFLGRNSTELVKNCVTDVASVFYAAMPAAFFFVIEALTCVVLGLMLVIIEPIAVPAVALLIGGGGWLFQRFSQKRSHALGKRVRERETSLVRRASQAFGGIKEVRIRGCEGHIVDTFWETSQDHAVASRMARFLNTSPRFVFETLAVGGMLLVAIIVLARGGGTARLVPLLGVMALAVVRMMPSAVRMLGSLGDMRYYAPFVDALHRDLSERETAVPVASTRAVEFERELRLSNVTYSYPGATKPSLDGVSLTIARGEAIALVGSSGAGKTTLADLLIGLLQPTSGQVLVDGTVLEPATIRSWQDLIGYVPQQVYLSDDTLLRNVAFGEPDHAIDRERVERALDAARLTDFVAGLPQGLGTVVGERGGRLSGGQRQRIGIARALYFDPKVLVLDEATSALDGLTEAEVVEAIDIARADRTTIVIAHRLSTVRGCDRLVYMSEGRIANVGTWEMLLASNAEFQRLVELGAPP